MITHSLIALLSNLLAHELLHPLRGLVVAGVGDYERHDRCVVVCGCRMFVFFAGRSFEKEVGLCFDLFG